MGAPAISGFSTCRSTYEMARATGLTQSAVVRKLEKLGLRLAAAHEAGQPQTK